MTRKRTPREPASRRVGHNLQMSLGRNLALAHGAIRQTLRDIDGAANWDQYRGGPSFEACTLAGAAACERLLDDLDVRVYKRVRGSNWGLEDDGVSLSDLRRISMAARQYRAGNCREYSAVAFIYLYDQKVAPLDWMALDADHAFVVLGRTEGSRRISDWGPACVVCDPWAVGFTGELCDGLYPATEFRRRMGRITRFKAAYSRFRVRAR